MGARAVGLARPGRLVDNQRWSMRLTLFNGVTLFILALTLATAAARWRGGVRTSWPLAYYAVVLGFAVGFPYSLNLAWVLAGTALALAIRFGARQWYVRGAEPLVFAYFCWRCTGLLLMW